MNRTATAKVPNELYDTLKPNEQEVWDLIGSLGFRPDKTDDQKWTGLSMKGDDIIPPQKSLSKLAEAVQKFVADKAAGKETENVASGETVIEADTKGNRYLPGTEPIVDEEIAAAAGKYHALKTERVGLLSQELDAKDELITVCHRKSDLFKPDPDNSNSKIYKVGDLIIRIANEWKEKVTTEIDKSDD